MKGVYAILRRFSRGLYVFSSMMLLVLLALLFRDAGGVMWRSICLVLFIGAVLYEAMWRSDRQSCPEVTGLMWFPAVLLCIPLFLGGLVRGFAGRRSPYGHHRAAVRAAGGRRTQCAVPGRDDRRSHFEAQLTTSIPV
ncbi:hypothetical protein FOC16_19210 [Salmonella enterica]|uniref:hypothetical protein n=1 Tax=Salmonella enterica TaxID=28901 RepID=UPI0012DD2F79|nr:hypothetical protein [Salmonella enterica]QGR34879.1 hypothetical protein FOC16_19210 [Salmonella enterica]